MRSDATLLLIDGPTVDEVLDPDAVGRAVVEAFTLHSASKGRVFPVVREQLPSGGIFGIKSGDVPSQSLLGFKAAGFWPANRAQGGEPHQATILLFDPATGRPSCVIDGNSITTARTGAAGAVGLTKLARPDSTCVAVFGTGVQARSQLRHALRALPSIRDVVYLSHDRQPNAGFESEFASRCRIASAHDANAAVSSSDIVITATPGAGPLFDADAVRPGTHLNCVGADTRGKRELPDGVLQRSTLFVDDRQQAAALGELQWAPALSCTEIGEVLAGNGAWNRDPSDVTVFDMTGLALQDLTTARVVFERAEASGLGQRIAWPW